MPQNIENSDIDINSVITITEQVYVTGSNGTVFSFIPFRQYVMCGETGPVQVTDKCSYCAVKVKDVYYYKVCIDSEEFLVPKDNACIEGYIRTEEEQDLYKLRTKKLVNQPLNYREVSAELLGHEINTGQIDYANKKIYQIIKSYKGKAGKG